MAVTPFSAGNFSAWSPLVEWDGTNEVDVRDWVRSLDPHNGSITEPDRWFLSSVTVSEVVLTRPSTHPEAFGGTQNVVVPVNGWVIAKVLLNGPTHLAVQYIPAAGKWVTSDPYGRPDDLNDLLP